MTSSPAGINCGSTCTASYAHGTLVTLTATTGPHIEAAQWTGCGEITAEDKCVVTMSAAKAVTVTFELQPGALFYAVTVERTGTGQGTVSGSPGSIVCGAVCSAEFLTGTTLTLNATHPRARSSPTGRVGAVRARGPARRPSTKQRRSKPSSP